MKSRKKFIYGGFFALVLAVISQSAPNLIKVGMAERLKEDEGFSLVVAYSDSISPEPNKNIAFRLWGGGKNIPLFSADIRLSPLGMFPPNASLSNDPKNFRLAILGGEQTASSVVSTSWPEYLQQILNQGVTGRRYSVINCAWPDAGPLHYLDIWNGDGQYFSSSFPKCKDFKPNLVIVNFMETDFYRFSKQGSVLLTYQNQPVNKDSLKIRYGNFTSSARYIGESLPSSMASPNVVPSRPFSFFGNARSISDAQQINYLRNILAVDFVKGYKPTWSDVFQSLLVGALPPAQLPKRRCLPVFDKCRTFFGITTSKLRNFDPPIISKSAETDAFVRQAAPTFQALQNLGPKVIFVLGFNLSNVTGNCKFPLAEGLANYIDFHYFNACRYASTFSLDSKDSFMFPYMTEKFTSLGMKRYATLIQSILKDSRLTKI